MCRPRAARKSYENTNNYHRQPKVGTSAVVCDEVPMKKYVAIVTASIVVEGFDSDDAAQAWKVSRVLHDLKKHGWTAHVDVCSHTKEAHQPSQSEA